MALIASDWTVSTNGDIRYIGAAHGITGASYATVIELHRWLQDLADDASASGDDLLDITGLTPSGRDTDNIINLLGTYNINQATSEHLYDGTIKQALGADIWDGIVNYGNEGIDIQLIQNGALVANDFWNSLPFGATLTGLNRDLVQGISHRFLVKTRTAGVDIDARRILGITREYGKTYAEFNINATASGNNVLALVNALDGNNTTASGTVGAWDSITNAKTDSTTTVNGTNAISSTTLNVVSGAAFTKGNFITIGSLTHEYQITNIATNALTVTPGLEEATTGGEIVYKLGLGYNGIDINNDTVNEFYYTNWNRDSYTINQFFERMKYLTRVGSTGRMYGLNAEIFRGITHEITVDTPTGTFAAVERVTWTGGTGQMLAITSPTTPTKMWIQLLTGTAPVDNVVITGTVSTATATVNVTVTERTALIKQPFAGTSTGTALSGGYGIGIEKLDLTAADKVFDLTNAQYSPPDYRVTTVAGLISTEDRVLVGPDNAGALQDGQFLLNAGITSGATSITVKVGTETPGTSTQSAMDTPSAGTLRVKDNTGVYQRVTYTGFTVAASTMTFTGCSGAPTAALDNQVFISYLDKLADGTSVTFTTIYHSPRTLFARVRDGGGSPIKTFENTVALGGSISAIRTPDV
jgi:hypothetical protein